MVLRTLQRDGRGLFMFSGLWAPSRSTHPDRLQISSGVMPMVTLAMIVTSTPLIAGQQIGIDESSQDVLASMTPR